MKKLILLVCLFVAAGISVNVMAQSTGIAPYPGATHTYQVVPNSNSNFVWNIKKDLITNADIASGDYETNKIASFTATDNSVVIKWANDAVEGTKYYLYVTETDKNTTCSNNSKAIEIVITASNFTLAVTGADSKCYNGNVTMSLNGSTIEYDHGDVTIEYTVTPTNNQGNWKFTIGSLSMSRATTDVSSDFEYATPTVSVVGAGTGDQAEISSNVVTVTEANGGSHAVKLTYTVKRNSTKDKLNNTSDADGTHANFDGKFEVTTASSGSDYGISLKTAGSTLTKTTSVARPTTPTITWN